MILQSKQSYMKLFEIYMQLEIDCNVTKFLIIEAV